MKVIGITGNTGSGKSTISKIIEKNYNGIIIDADRIAREMSENQSEYLKEIENQFGKEIIEYSRQDKKQEKKLNRKKLADIVFCDKTAKERLDKITFKYVVKEIEKRLEDAKNEKRYSYIVLDVPLLFESKLNEECDYTIGVIAKKEEKIDRICKRDNISRQKALERLSSQPENEFYIKNCNFIIENLGNQTSDLTSEQLNEQPSNQANDKLSEQISKQEESILRKVNEIMLKLQ